MRCVACKEPMVVLEVDHVEIDHCLECGGVWLDAGELEMLLDTPGRVPELLRAALEPTQEAGRGLRCPICGRIMKKFRAGSDQSVEIDLCAADHGLWFERGELEQLIVVLSNRADRIVELLRGAFGNH